MNAWLAAAAVLVSALVPAGLAAARMRPLDAAPVLQVGGVLTTLALVLLSQGFDRPAYFWVPLVFAPLSFIGTLAFVRVVERWL